MKKTNQESKISARDSFLSIKDTKTNVKPLELPELGISAFVKPMGAFDQDTLSQELLEFYEENGETKWKHNPAGIKLKTLVRILCDGKGDRLFKDDEYTLLGDKPQDVIEQIYVAAIAVHKTPENLEKNSFTAEKGGSLSD